MFKKQVFSANPDIEIIGEYCGRHQPVKAKCKICGYEWEPQAASLLRGSNHKGWKGIHKKMISLQDDDLENARAYKLKDKGMVKEND